MEDSKKDVYQFTIQTPWVKALLAFVIFLLIFIAGAMFGSHFGGSHHSRYNGFQMRGGNMMYNSGYAVPVTMGGGTPGMMGQLPPGQGKTTTPVSGTSGTTSSTTPVSNSASQ